MARITQASRVLRHLKAGFTITQGEASNDYAISRLAAVICTLRESHNILTIDTSGVNRFGEKTSYATYKLVVPVNTQEKLF